MKPCTECGGSGRVPEMDIEGEDTGTMAPCPQCGGSGEVQEDADDPATVQT